MSDTSTENLLKRIPTIQRTVAEKRINNAISMGWQKIDLMQDGTCDIADLVGVSPGGDFEFLADHFE